MFKKITRGKLSSFLADYATDEEILDIGAGGSSYHTYFPKRITLDIDPARKPDIVGDAHHLPFPDASFSMVLCTEVLEHAKDPKVVLSEIFRVLKPGGKVVLTTRFVYPLHDTPHDYWRFTKYGLQNLFGRFTIEKIMPETNTFSTIAVLIQRIAFQSELRMNKVSKFILFCIAGIVGRLQWLIRKEYGSIRKDVNETNIMASGYYVVARKQ